MKKIHLTTSLLALSFFLYPLTVLQGVIAQPQGEGKLTIAQAKPANKQSIIVHLRHGTDDLHAVIMALKMASGLQNKGASVILLLTQEGVRIADTRQPQNLRWGNSPMTIGEMYENFVKAGGKVIVCPVCAEAVGLTANSLRPGAQFAQGNNDIPSIVLAADKILGF
ncbi:MAG: DsrE family protein [Snowella sp.]